MLGWQLLITNARTNAVKAYKFDASHNSGVGVNRNFNQGSVEVSDSIKYGTDWCGEGANRNRNVRVDFYDNR